MTEVTAETPGVAARLADAFRIATFRSVPIERIRPRWAEIVAAVVLTIAVPTLHAVVRMDAPGMFAPSQLPSALFVFAMSLLTAIGIASASKREDLVPPVLFATLLAWVVVDVLSYGVWEILRLAFNNSVPWALEWTAFALPFTWWALAVLRFAWPLPAPGWGKPLAALIPIALLAIPFIALNPDRGLWARDWSKEPGEARNEMFAAGTEAAFYSQPELLAKSLDAVQPERPGVVDLYFVGVAGYAMQDVFMREVKSVWDLMEERFDAGGRSIALVNNPKTVLEVPVASASSLRAALARMGERMNVEEDVLVLFLTSHGSHDHKFSIELPPLRFAPIEPAQLKAMLDDSGIRNRVVIVSACYAGGFAAPLADPRTLVIAAAAPDRNSFGCTNEAEWTYFGRAYFDEALRKTRSFTRAFEVAAPAIAARERAEEHEPSMPMMRGGEALRDRLAALESRLERTADTGGRPDTLADIASPQRNQ